MTADPGAGTLLVTLSRDRNPDWRSKSRDPRKAHGLAVRHHVNLTSCYSTGVGQLKCVEAIARWQSSENFSRDSFLAPLLPCSESIDLYPRP